MQVLMYICIYVRMVCMYGIYKWRSDKGWIVAAIRNMHSMSVYMYVCTVVPSPGLSLSGKDTESLFPATRAPTGCPHRPRTSLHMESSSVYVVCIYMQSMGFIRVVPFFSTTTACIFSTKALESSLCSRSSSSGGGTMATTTVAKARSSL